jgi:2-keto-4-pentenoate hydratase/2-oxohepta-3-ene-1,7-dioic acid hydratase in catechol pathway
VESFVRFERTDGTAGAALLEGDRLHVVEEPFWTQVRPTGEELAASSVRLLAPSQPRIVLGVGLNYHAGLGDRPALDPPALFSKPSVVAGPGDEVRLPPDAHKVIPEGEVVAVIGRRLHRAGAAEAAEAVFGLTAGNDVTARDWLRSPGDWWRAKGSDTFTVGGPAIVTGLDPADIGLRVRVNGVEVSSGRTSDMVVPVPELLASVSRYVALEPGDWVFTGTPSRVAPLADGDVVEVDVEGVGVLRNPVVADGKAMGESRSTT